MKRTVTYLATLLLFATTALSCKEENYGTGKIDIFFASSSLFIDLNILNNPPVISVINSENPLQSVEFFILKDDAVEKYGKTATSFFNPKSYSINEQLVYAGDMTGVRVVATDAGGNVQQKDLPFDVKQVLGAPEIIFNPESVAMTEGGTIPHFTATITALSPLKTITFFKVVRGVETQITDPIEVFVNPFGYNFDIDHLSQEIIFIPGITSFKIQAVDNYGKERIASLPINYTELPYPTVTFNQSAPLNADEFANVVVSGTITGASDFTTATFKVKGKDASVTDITMGTVNYPAGTKSTTFSYTISSITTDYNAFEVKVSDVISKTTTATLNIIVTGYPAPEIATPVVGGNPVTNYYAIEKGTQISLAGYVITSSPADVKKVVITTTSLNGTETSTTVDNINAASYTPTQSIEAVADLAKITITATNAKDKVTTKEIPVSVDCWILKNLTFQERIGTNATGATQLCIFSSVQRTVLSLQAARSAQSDCDFVVITNTSPAGSVRFNSLVRNDIAGKYSNTTYGFATWTTFNATRLGTLTATSNPTILPADFFLKTADNIRALPALAEATGGTANSATTQGVVRVSDDTPTLQIVYFETIARNGKIQRGIIKLEGSLDGSYNQYSMYEVSIILTTPYTP